MNSGYVMCCLAKKGMLDTSDPSVILKHRFPPLSVRQQASFETGGVPPLSAAQRVLKTVGGLLTNFSLLWTI